MIRIRTLAIFTLTCLIASEGFCASFKGYQKPKGAGSVVLTDVVWKVDESDTNFLILLKHHDSFYKFPKQRETATMIRNYLQNNIRQNSMLALTIDPFKAHIYEISQSHP